jgi:DNA-binding HxlR family transcriptional regulator
MPKTKKNRLRSHCPVNFVLETVGDKWSLLIVRDIMLFRRKTYGEFLMAGEGIATNILASRLEHLEKEGILRKFPHDEDKRKDYYVLTEKGLDLVPIVLEMVAWGAKYNKNSAARRRKQFVSQIRKNKKNLSDTVKNLVCGGGYVFSD